MSKDRFDAAIRRVVKVNNSTRGKAQIVRINGKDYEAIKERINLDAGGIDGGIGEYGGFSVQLPVSDFKGRIPEKNQPIKIDGIELQVATIAIINATLEITAVDTSVKQ